ncbi:hypothetical protein OJF2_79520 (plasmid) [Aquisphaera giovannonii]|uniref:Uncharacterized protein n=1 Tax=Aquisphaera giovannonii TaxID=406548 RepID=A0A5B9WFM8_9BACT|nr:hypothetical protein [Aquisphaera giovannonii]QEH39337.1 hypothetical protein OJF2_79520 [Aquisphaera giovannonii]
MMSYPPRTDAIFKASATPPRGASPLIFADGVLCRLRTWTEDEWLALTASDRPMRYVHAPGLGYVGAVRVEPME